MDGQFITFYIMKTPEHGGRNLRPKSGPHCLREGNRGFGGFGSVWFFVSVRSRLFFFRAPRPDYYCCRLSPLF